MGKSTVQKILTNETYTGVWHWGRTRKTSETTHVERPRNEWIPMEVPIIIGREQFDAARAQAERNKKGASRNTHRQYLMQGRLVCAVCGMHFRVDWNNRVHGPEKGHYYCGGQKAVESRDFKTKICTRFIRQEALDAAVWEHIKGILKDPDLITIGVRQQQAKMDSESGVLKERLAMVQQLIADLEGQQRKLLDLYLASDGIPKELLTEKLADIARREEGVHARSW